MDRPTIQSELKADIKNALSPMFLDFQTILSLLRESNIDLTQKVRPAFEGEKIEEIDTWQDVANRLKINDIADSIIQKTEKYMDYKV